MPVGLIPDREYSLDELRLKGSATDSEIREAFWRTMALMTPEQREEEADRLERDRREAQRAADAMARARLRREQELQAQKAAEAERALIHAEDARWETVGADADFAALFLASPVVEAVAGQPGGIPRLLVEPSVCWRFESGVWLAMQVEIEGDYSCGYEVEKTYRTYRP